MCFFHVVPYFHHFSYTFLCFFPFSIRGFPFLIKGLLPGRNPQVADGRQRPRCNQHHGKLSGQRQQDVEGSNGPSAGMGDEDSLNWSYSPFDIIWGWVKTHAYYIWENIVYPLTSYFWVPDTLFEII